MKRYIIVLACLCLNIEAFGVIQDKGTYQTNGIGHNVRLYTSSAPNLYTVVASGSVGTRFINVDDPNSPSLTGTFTNGGSYIHRGIEVAGDTAYIACRWRGVLIVNISNPASPTLIKRLGSTSNGGFDNLMDVTVDLVPAVDEGKFDVIAYVTEERFFFTAKVTNADAQNPAVLDYLVDEFDEILEYSPLYGLDVADIGASRYAYVANGDLGLRIFDVTDPAAITQENLYDTEGTAFDVDIDNAGEYVFVAIGSEGLLILDLNDPTDPGAITTITVGGIDARGVDLDGDYAYIADRYNRMSILDISDPTSPFFVDLWVYNNSAPVNAVIKDGNYAYVVSGAEGTAGRLRIAQVSDLAFYKTFPKGKFELIGIPTNVIAAAQNPISLFGDDINNNTYPIGEPNWRWSRWDNDRFTYVRYGEVDGDSLDADQDPDLTPPAIEPGLGYWLRQDVSGGSTVSLDILEAQLTGIVDQGTPYVLPLESVYIVDVNTFRGLNMMANPFPYLYEWGVSYIINTTEDPDSTLSISDAATAGWINQYAYSWQSGTSQYIPGAPGEPASSYNSWSGFWVEVTTTDALELMFIPKNSGGGGGAPAEPEEDDPLLDWELQLEVARIDREYLDPYNIIGVKPESRRGYDRWDAFDYAPFSNRYLRLYFPHPEWEEVIADKFSYDYRAPQFEEPEVWEFKVETRGLPRGEYRLSWPNLDEIHEAYTFELQDLTNNVRIANLREELIYDFEIDPEVSNEVDFCLRVSYIAVSAPDEAKEISPTEFGLINLYPNPFNDVSLISFRVPASMEVTLGVYDLGGRLVRNLHQGQIGAGLQQVSWDASGENTGLYFIRLESEGFSSVRKAMLLR